MPARHVAVRRLVPVQVNDITEVRVGAVLDRVLHRRAAGLAEMQEVQAGLALHPVQKAHGTDFTFVRDSR